MTDDEFWEYWTYLVKKKHEEHPSTDDSLTSDERVFYSANIFRGSVPRSGLLGYFLNTECDVIRDAHHALSVLGLPDALKLLQDAQRIILNGESLPEKDQFLTLYDNDLPDEELEKAMDDLDGKVREIQEQLYLQDDAIYDSLCRFADERKLRAPSAN